MKKIFIFILLFLSFYFATSQTPVNDNHWIIQDYYSDEFDFLNLDKWTVKDHTDHWGKPYLFLDSNVVVDGGMLQITVQNEDYRCPSAFVDQWHCVSQYNDSSFVYHFTSGWIESKKDLPAINYYYSHGYVEARIKMRYEYGLNQAFWTYMSHGGIFSEEIDIFEMTESNTSVQGTNLHYFYTAGHTEKVECEYTSYDTRKHCLDDTLSCSENPYCICMAKGCYAYHPPIPSYEDTWRVFGLEWNNNKLIWYCDGKVIRNSPNTGMHDPAKFIMDIGMRKNNMPDTATFTTRTMYVDWIHFYKLDTAYNESINAINYDFATYNNKVQNYIKIGEEGNGGNELGFGDNVSIRASQFIEINGEFTVPLGAEFYADADSMYSTIITPTSCSQIFNPCYYDFNLYDSNSIKKIIELGKNGCSADIKPSGSQDIILQATNYIEIGGEVTIEPSESGDVILQNSTCY
jgi:beta-glucanase (GH16 family)